jgi:hypothetical protein
METLLAQDLYGHEAKEDGSPTAWAPPVPCREGEPAAMVSHRRRRWSGKRRGRIRILRLDLGVTSVVGASSD